LFLDDETSPISAALPHFFFHGLDLYTLTAPLKGMLPDQLQCCMQPAMNDVAHIGNEKSVQRTEQNLPLAIASTVSHGFGPRRDP
jgi:hypothetical protein